MSLRVPFFGLISRRSPMQDLLKHYEQIAKGMELIEDSLECYITGGGVCKEFQQLFTEVDELEDKADKIKRSIRNHLPRGLFMAVDKTLFLNYTRSQDDIFDNGEEALNWLVMRDVTIPENFQKKLLILVSEVVETVALLKPALKATIGLVHGDHYDRHATKETYRSVRKQHKKVWRLKNEIISLIYNSDLNFKDIHQLINFIECMDGMSHNAEGCADILRAMIAR